MIKKEYMKPAMEICQVDTVQMLAGSLTSVNTTGLDEASKRLRDDLLVCFFIICTFAASYFFSYGKNRQIKF